MGVKGKPEKTNKFMALSGMAFQMIATILLFTFSGIWLDDNVNTAKFPTFTLIGSLLGIFIALYIVIKTVVNISKDD